MIYQVISVAPKSIPYMWHQVKPLIDKTQNRPDDCLNTEEFHELITQGLYRLVIGLELNFSGDFKSLNSDDIKSTVV